MRTFLLLAPVPAVILMAMTSWADDGPVITPAPERSDSAEAIQAPAAALPPAVRSEGWLETREIQPVPGVHVGEVLTVAPAAREGAPVPVLTDGEVAKLAMARAAVAAARDAGTLHVTAAAPAPAPLPDSAGPPEAGIGVQLPVPHGAAHAPLTDWERAKQAGQIVPSPEHFPASGATPAGGSR